MPSISGFTWNSVTTPTGSGVVLEVGAGKQYATVQEAYAASSAGDTIMVYEGTYVFEGNEYHPQGDNKHPIIISHDIQIIGVGNVVFDINNVAKGALVTGGDANLNIYIENITFQGANNLSRNAAGIRHQEGSLTVVDSRFEGNHNGILADSHSASVHVYNSEFIGNGTDGFSHGIYAHGAELIVENSYFSGNIHGHHIKSVATDRTIIYNNYVEDGNGSASYHVDATGGGDLLVYDNDFIRGEHADNFRFIYYDSSRNGGEPGTIVVENNHFDATAIPADRLHLVIGLFNETTSIVEFNNNTVLGVPEDSIVVGWGNSSGNMLDGQPVAASQFDSTAVSLTANDDVLVLTEQEASPFEGDGGNDALIGAQGADSLYGQSGNDLLVGNDGEDKLRGDDGADTIFGGSGKDVLDGGDGDDYIDAGTGRDFVNGGNGDDTIVSEHAGILIGGLGNDLIIGGSDREVLVGGDGDDTIFGGDLSDTIHGGAGNDILVYQGTFNPNLSTNADEAGWRDTAFTSGYDFAIAYTAWWSNELVVWGISESGMDQTGNGLNYYAGNVDFNDKESFNGIEKIQFDNGVYDVATGTFSPGLILVDIGNILSSLPSNPSNTEDVNGTENNDTFLVDPIDGFAEYFGLGGYDIIAASADNMSIRLSNFVATSAEEVSANGFTGVSIMGTSGDDTLNFGSATLQNIDYIDAGMGNDLVVGSSQADTISGGFGVDTLHSGNGDDVFQIGLGEGDDVIHGEEGTDIIRLGSGVNSFSLRNTTFSAADAEIIQLDSPDTLTINAINTAFSWNLEAITFTNVLSLVINMGSTGDQLTGSSLDEQVFAGGGSDTVSSGVGNDTLSGEDGNDVLSGGSGNDVIIGGAGDDVVDGGTGDDTFEVGLNHGLDHYSGGDGDDTILATADNVAIGLLSDTNQAVRSGIDSIEVIDAGGHTGVTIVGRDWNAGAYFDDLDFSNTTLIGIERIDLGDGHDTLVGSAGDDVIVGGAGHDVLDGGDGNDTFEVGTGSGRDVFIGGNGDDTILATANDAIISFRNFGAGDVETISAGGHTGVTIQGHPSSSGTIDFSATTLVGISQINLLGGWDNFTGSAGDDVVDGGTGNDVLRGGDGNDTFLVGLSSGEDRFFGEAGTDQILATADNVVIGISQFSAGDVESIDAGSHTGVIIQGSTSYTDSIDFSATTLVGISQINLRNGNDTLIGSAGDDVVDGGSGSDVIDGGNGDDTITGGEGNDSLTGGNGNDTFLVGMLSGEDRFIGGAGTDQILAITDNAVIGISHFDGGDVETISSGGHTGVTIQGLGSTSNSIDFSNTTLTGIGRIDLGNGQDTIVGSAGDDVIVGGAGHDVLNGGDGNDTFEVGTGAGLDVFIGGNGDDTILATANDAIISFRNFAAGDVETISAGGHTGVIIQGHYSSPDNIDLSATTLVGISQINTLGGFDNVTGSAGDDVIDGGPGNDVLRGGDGDDTFLVGLSSGEDRFFGDAGTDQVLATADNVIIGMRNFAAGDVETISAGGHTGVIIQGHYSSPDSLDFSATTLVGITQINTLGGFDSVTGSAGDDVIDGGSGNDVLRGGDGDDTFLVGLSSGEDRFFGDAGTDQILATADNVVIGISEFGAGDVETIDAGGHTGVIIQGATSYTDSMDFSATTLIGISQINLRDGNDTVIGSAGNDVIDGGSGNDVIDGGNGDDTITGGAGVDTFVFADNWGQDVVNDFSDGEDLIDLSATALTFAQLVITQTGSDTSISDGTGNIIILSGVNSSSVTADDFVF